MRALCWISVLWSCVASSGATWYVRPTPQGSHDGTSYANAWGALTNVVWGVSGVNNGDTLYVAGLHVLIMHDAPFTQGQLNLVSGVTVRGDYTGDPGTVFCCAQWQLAGENNWQGPDANGVYWNPTINRNSNYYPLAFQVGTTNIYRLDLQTTTTWTGGLGSSAFIGNTNFVKTVDGSKPNGNLATTQYGYCFNIAGLQNVTFRSLTVIGPMFPSGFIVGASNITFTACTLSDNCLDFLVTKNDNWIFGGNDISYALAGGIYAYDSGASGNTGPNNLTITNNYFHTIGFGRYGGSDGHAVGVRGAITNCTISGNTSVGTCAAIDFYGGPQTNVTISYNFVKDTAIGVLDTGHGIALEGGGSKVGFQIYGNVLENIGTNSTQDYHGCGIAGGPDSLVDIWNNTIHNANVGLEWTPASTALKIKFQNNIVSLPRYSFYRTSSTGLDGSGVVDNNLFYTNSSIPNAWNISGAFTHDTHSVFANPSFASPSPTVAADFRLNTGSPAIGAGTAVGIATDFGGAAFKNPPAIGAWESVLQQYEMNVGTWILR